MNDIKLGTRPTEEAQRDAIHIAIAPVVAGTHLLPGTHVHIENGKAWETLCDKAIGIVDPFLKRKVMAGERFWLLLYQNTVVGMRHHWSHPAFSDAPPSEGRSETMTDEPYDGDDNDCCGTCGGEGVVEYNEAGPEVWGEDCPSEENHLVICPNCRGSGQLKDCTSY